MVAGQAEPAVRSQRPGHDAPFTDGGASEQAAARPGTVRLESGTIAYEDYGDHGLAVVMPLSYGVTVEGLRQAYGQTQFLRAVAAQAHLVAFNQRRPEGSTVRVVAASWDERAADVWRVADAAGVQRAVLYGVADAVHTVLHAATQQPERVLGLVFNLVPPMNPGTAAGPIGDTLALMQDYGIATGDAGALAAARDASAGEQASGEMQRLLASSSIEQAARDLDVPALLIDPQRRAGDVSGAAELASTLPRASLVRPARGIQTLGAIHAFLATLVADLGPRASSLSPELSAAMDEGEEAMAGWRVIAVVVEDDARSARAVELACRLGAAQRSEIVLVHVAAVPYRRPLEQLDRTEIARGEQALRLGEAIVERHALHAQSRLVPARSIAGGIVSTAQAAAADLIVLPARDGAAAMRTEDVTAEVVRRAAGRVIVDQS